MRDFPWRADVHSLLGNTLVQLNRLEEARRAYEQVLQIQVEDDNPYIDPVAIYRQNLQRIAEASKR
ncbi:tetratricopeptide repeat protein [Steroidobacter sp.]|uniref:tetratricopeptide repeat protein n=1 Tax=Steroidobacter sp. TaxID=1978227 RepID=UPI001A42C72D|nr:tetratricopeptide repeat protein [Steroidobacter sp.]MBL8268799.1 tetratricopeptide repeat protein [Steroidobacter sp.]